jgi:hypothetical protein
MWEVGYCDIDGYVFKGEDYLQISVDEQNNQCAAVTKEAIDLSTLDGQYYVHLH